jgi:ADP-ribose pyrophosphatase
MDEITLEREIIYTGKIISLHRDKVVLDNGNTTYREVVTHPGATCVLPLAAGRITLVQQYRKPVEQGLWEIPAGKLEEGEDPLESAHRELVEETGLEAQQMRFLGKFFTSPGFSSELMYAYIATDLSQVKANPDEDEILKIKSFALNEIDKMIRDEIILDGKTLLTFYLARALFAKEFDSK